MRFLTKIVVATVCSAALFACPNPASAIDLVVPGAYANAEADWGNAFPFSIDDFSVDGINPIPSMRYQQVYGNSAFSSISGSILITQIAFRPAGPEPGGIAAQGSFRSTLLNVRIELSTTRRQVDGLSDTFADNTGVDRLTVFNGSLTLSSAGAVGLNPAPFDVLINLTTPFLYNPAEGNLLLDVRNFGGGLTGFLDASRDTNDAMSRVYNFDANNAVADTRFPLAERENSGGLVTRFQFAAVTVPEAGTVPLAASGLLLLGGAFVARRSRRTA